VSKGAFLDLDAPLPWCLRTIEGLDPSKRELKGEHPSSAGEEAKRASW